MIMRIYYINILHKYKASYMILEIQEVYKKN